MNAALISGWEEGDPQLKLYEQTHELPNLILRLMVDNKEKIDAAYYEFKKKCDSANRKERMKAHGLVALTSLAMLILFGLSLAGNSSRTDVSGPLRFVNPTSLIFTKRPPEPEIRQERRKGEKLKEKSRLPALAQKDFSLGDSDLGLEVDFSFNNWGHLDICIKSGQGAYCVFDFRIYQAIRDAATHEEAVLKLMEHMNAESKWFGIEKFDGEERKGFAEVLAQFFRRNHKKIDGLSELRRLTLSGDINKVRVLRQQIEEAEFKESIAREAARKAAEAERERRQKSASIKPPKIKKPQKVIPQRRLIKIRTFDRILKTSR